MELDTRTLKSVVRAVRSATQATPDISNSKALNAACRALGYSGYSEFEREVARLGPIAQALRPSILGDAIFDHFYALYSDGSTEIQKSGFTGQYIDAREAVCREIGSANRGVQICQDVIDGLVVYVLVYQIVFCELSEISGSLRTQRIEAIFNELLALWEVSEHTEPVETLISEGRITMTSKINDGYIRLVNATSEDQQTLTSSLDDLEDDIFRTRRDIIWVCAENKVHISDNPYGGFRLRQILNERLAESVATDRIIAIARAIHNAVRGTDKS